MQLFWDITDDWNLTVGAFEYHNEIDQDLDFWTDTSDSSWNTDVLLQPIMGF